MEKQINITAVTELLSIADRPESDGPPGITTRAAALKNGLGVYKTALDNLDKMVDKVGKAIGKDDEVNVVLNTTVKILKDLVQKVNTQGGMIQEIFDEMKKRPAEDANHEELEKVKAECKKSVEDKRLELKAEMNETVDKLKNKLEKKHTELEKEVDEGRQREMKGTIIVSSPDRGNIRTLAVHRPRLDYQGNMVGMETDMEMVLRMVTIKTGVRFPLSDIVACHRIGKNKRTHSYVLKIGNRQPFSAWEALNNAMMTGSMSKDNIFINFMLTKARTEMSKQVRQLKKERKIQSYSIDQNGKFFIKKNGNDSSFEFISFEDIQKLVRES